jgi:hypothetical protein
MIRASDGMIIVDMEGWEQSDGIAAEIEICNRLGKPITHVAPPPCGSAR